MTKIPIMSTVGQVRHPSAKPWPTRQAKMGPQSLCIPMFLSFQHAQPPRLLGLEHQLHGVANLDPPRPQPATYHTKSSKHTPCRLLCSTPGRSPMLCGTRPCQLCSALPKRPDCAIDLSRGSIGTSHHITCHRPRMRTTKCPSRDRTQMR